MLCKSCAAAAAPAAHTAAAAKYNSPPPPPMAHTKKLYDIEYTDGATELRLVPEGIPRHMDLDEFAGNNHTTKNGKRKCIPHHVLEKWLAKETLEQWVEKEEQNKRETEQQIAKMRRRPKRAWY